MAYSVGNNGGSSACNTRGRLLTEGIYLRPQLLPNTNVLVDCVQKGMTHRQIAELVNDQNRRTMGSSYRPITRSAVAVALHRAGAEPGRPRYREEIPWQPIKTEHNNNYRLTMLRVHARVKAGDQNIPERLLKEYQSFARMCEQTGSVVHYDPTSGFQTVKAREGIDCDYIRLTDEQIIDRGLVEKMREMGYPFPTK